MAYWFFKATLSPVLFLLWRVRTEGRHRVPRRGAAVLAANHQSFCDSFFLPLVLRRRVTYLAKAEYFDRWRTAWFFRSAGQIPIRRGGGGASQRALETATEVIALGRLLAVYPEGTRSRDCSVHRGKTGVARLASETGVPVIPVGIVGTDRIQPIGSQMMHPFHRVTVRFGAPMTLRGMDAQDPEAREAAVRSFTDQLMQEICRLSGRPYVDCYEATSSGSAMVVADRERSVTGTQQPGDRDRVA